MCHFMDEISYISNEILVYKMLGYQNCTSASWHEYVLMWDLSKKFAQSCITTNNLIEAFFSCNIKTAVKSSFFNLFRGLLSISQQQTEHF